MKPVDSDTVPHHLRHLAGTTGLVHGLAPLLPRGYMRDDARMEKAGRRGRKAKARHQRLLLERFGRV